MHASLKLIQIFFSSALRRLRYDLIRELVVLFCAALLGATFYYIFNDFVNEQMGRLQPELKSQTVKVLSWILLAIVTQWQANRVRSYIWSQKSLYQMSLRLGEAPTHSRIFLGFTVTVFLLTSSSVIWFLIQTSLHKRSPLEIIVTQSLLFLYISLLVFKGKAKESRQKREIKLKPGTAPLTTMWSWRLQQVLRRNLAARFSLFFALAAITLATYMTTITAPDAALFMLLYLVGFFASLPVFFQLSTDLKMAWAERTMGVSHELVMSVYRRLAYGLFIPLIIPFIVVFLFHSDGQSADVVRLLQYVGVAVTPVYLAPFLMFQIDAHRPAIQILTLFFTGLFIATAIFVHLIGLVLLPGFSYYASASQAGRYYRV